MYAAKHHVRVGGAMLAAGEVLPDGLPTERIDWLLRAGAIVEIEEAKQPATPPTATEEEKLRREVRDNYSAQLDDLGYSTDGTPKDTEPEEIDDEVEPEEIDATAGLVTPSVAEETPKPVKRGRKKP